MTVTVKPKADVSYPGDLLREALRHVAGSVSIITAGVGDARTGLTATSATSLSVDPPTMLVAVNRQASAWTVIRSHRHYFCVNFLGADHHDLAERFAGRKSVNGAERYGDASWVQLATGARVLADAVAAIDCEVQEIIERHSHDIIIGAVKAVLVNGGDVLVYGQRQYGSFVPR